MSAATLAGDEKLSMGAEDVSSAPASGSQLRETTLEPEQKLEENAIAADDNDGPPPMPKTRLILLLMGLTLSIFLVALDFNIITTAIPRITDEFQDLNSVAWYGAAFFLTTSSLQGPWGKMYKLFNLKWIVLAALSIFELGSLICGLAHNNPTLIIGRAVQGIGASGLQNGTYTIVGVVLQPRQRPLFTGVLGTVFGITSVIGPLLGGVFTDRASWRWCFFVNLPLGGAVVLTLLYSMKPPKQCTREGMSWKEIILQMDLLGVAFIFCAALCLIFVLQWGGIEKPWGDSAVIGCLVGFFLLVTAFAVDQYAMKERASFPFRILKQRNVAIAAAWNFLIGGGFILHMYLLPLYFQSVQGVSSTESGVRMLPLIISMALFSVLGAGFITAMGMPAHVMILGAGLTCVGSGLVYTLGIDTEAGRWIGYLILLGAGYGWSLQLGIIVAQASSVPTDIAVTTAAVNFTQTYGGALAVSIAQTIFSNKLIEGITANVPGIDPLLVVHGGATDLRRLLPSDKIGLVIQVFMASLTDAFVLPIALTGLAFILAFLLGRNMWRKGPIKLAGMA